MSRSLRKLCCPTVLLAAFMVLPAIADVPREITFQGKLTGNGTDPVSLEVRFYDTATGGNLLWSELHPSVPRPDGLFTINIGSQTAGGVPDDALDYARIDANAEGVWLGVSVDGGDELTPRTQLVMVPYAAKAKSSENLVRPGTFESAVAVSASGAVGIGTTSPNYPLDVFGDGAIRGNLTLLDAQGQDAIWIRADELGVGWANPEIILRNSDGFTTVEVDGDDGGRDGIVKVYNRLGDEAVRLYVPNDGPGGRILVYDGAGGAPVSIDGASAIAAGNARLVVGTTTEAGSNTAEFRNHGSVANAGGVLFSQGSTYAVKARATGTGSLSGALRFSYVNRDDGSVVADNVLKITAAGISTPVITITGADVAERFPSSETLEPGSVVEIDPAAPGKLRLARQPYSRLVAGVASGAGNLPAGAVLGDQPGSEHMPPIAMAGRVWVKCDASYGAVKPGDRLTTSATAGHAMKVADHDKAIGAVIGKAMTGLNEGQGLVLMLVQPQ
jgi:hypothetical protein